MAAIATPLANSPDEKTYRRRINAWALYDVANSAFFTTILAAVLPAYYSAVAGATLPSPAYATQRWSISLSIALFITALLSPILGTLSDIVRGKKALLAVFATIGIIATGLMVLIGTGDWLLASVLIVFARLGAAGSIVFYDALLPHIARDEDQDRVSTLGYALGYLGGGVLLAINVVMINVIPDDIFPFAFEFAGVRLSLFSVAIWWALFTIPLFLQIPEPQSATQKLKAGENVVSASFRQLGATFRDLSQYRELFKYLIAFLIYNDGIGTIIGVATIYGAELGFQTTELILALLLVQFVGIPFSFIFGVLPNPESKRRSGFLAFIVFNAVALPIVGVALRYTLPVTVTGAPVPDYTTVGDFRGQGDYAAPTFITGDVWQTQAIDGALLDADADVQYVFNIGADAAYEIPFNGQRVDFTYAMGADFGIFALELDGAPFLDDDGQPQTIDTYSANARYGLDETIDAPTPGQHTLRLVNTGEANPASSGNQLGFGTVTVKPPVRGGNLLMILGALLAVQAAGALFAVLGGWRLLKPLADSLNTKRSIILSLVVYCMIAIWGFFLNSTVEFWFLAWMVGIVQGGSQALSRSMYAGMTPASKSGEFFGLFAIMEKFSAIIGPLLFALAVGIFGNSRPAILSLIALFIIGGYLLTRVDVEAGRKLAHEENARLAGES